MKLIIFIVFLFLLSLANHYFVSSLRSQDFCCSREKKCHEPHEYKCGSELCTKNSLVCHSYLEISRHVKAIAFIEPTYLNDKIKELNQIYMKRLKSFLTKINNCTRRSAYVWRPEHVSIYMRLNYYSPLYRQMLMNEYVLHI